MLILLPEVLPFLPQSCSASLLSFPFIRLVTICNDLAYFFAPSLTASLSQRDVRSQRAGTFPVLWTALIPEPNAISGTRNVLSK